MTKRVTLLCNESSREVSLGFNSDRTSSVRLGLRSVPSASGMSVATVKYLLVGKKMSDLLYRVGNKRL